MANDDPFLFYSGLYGRPVLDPDGNAVGRLDDLAVTLAETFPAVTALLIRRGRVESFRLTARWRDVESVDPTAVRLRVPVERLVPGRRLPSEPSFWVGQALLDRQIVDTSGAKVVRVNDLHFLHVPTGYLHLVHVDVGFRGLVRRLGWSTTMGKEQLISWRYVQPLTLAATGDTLQLTVPPKELGRLHPAELADILTELDGRERESLFRALAPEAPAPALTEVEPMVRQRLLAGLPAARAAHPAERLPPDAAGAVLATPPSASPRSRRSTTCSPFRSSTLRASSSASSPWTTCSPTLRRAHGSGSSPTPPERARRRPLAERAPLPGRHGPRHHHRQRRQRRGRDHDLLARGRALRLRARVDARPDHGRARGRAGDVRPHGRRHRQGPRRPDPRELRGAAHLLRHGPPLARGPWQERGRVRGSGGEPRDLR